MSGTPKVTVLNLTMYSCSYSPTSVEENLSITIHSVRQDDRVAFGEIVVQGLKMPHLAWFNLSGGVRVLLHLNHIASKAPLAGKSDLTSYSYAQAQAATSLYAPVPGLDFEILFSRGPETFANCSFSAQDLALTPRYAYNDISAFDGSQLHTVRLCNDRSPRVDKSPYWRTAGDVKNTSRVL